LTQDRDYELRQVLDAYRKDGSLIREKARVLTEEGLEYIYSRMVQEDLSTAGLLDILKYLAEIGDLKPKQSTTPQNAGAGFSITINIPQGDKPPITIDAQAVDVPTTDGDGVMGEVPLSDVPIAKLPDLRGDQDDDAG
jgi:hypothetical protein